MQGFNKVMLLGNLTADPELRFTQGGQAVLSIRLATNETYLDKDKQRKERTDYHIVVVWGARAEALSKILHKGSGAFIEGSLRTSSYDDREGNKRYKTEVIAKEVMLTGGRSDGSHESHDAPPRQARQQAPSRGGKVAPDSDLDGKYGNPEIKFDPRGWTGESFKNKPMSMASPDYLYALAEALESMAEKEQDEKRAGYKRQDAARARGWAKRAEKGSGGGGANTDSAGDYSGDYGGGVDEDIPF